MSAAFTGSVAPSGASPCTRGLQRHMPRPRSPLSWLDAAPLVERGFRTAVRSIFRVEVERDPVTHHLKTRHCIFSASLYAHAWRYGCCLPLDGEPAGCPSHAALAAVCQLVLLSTERFQIASRSAPLATSQTCRSAAQCAVSSTRRPPLGQVTGTRRAWNPRGPRERADSPAGRHAAAP